MSDLSNFLENELTKYFRNLAITQPAVVYLALFTAVTDAEAGTGTEVVGGSYARVAVTFGAPSNGVIVNSVQVSFPTASANWGVVTHAALFDALTVGNALSIIKALTTSRTINNGDTLQFPIGNVSMALA